MGGHEPHPGISLTEVSMNNNSTLYVGLDVHNESIIVADAINSEPVVLPGAHRWRGSSVVRTAS